MKTLNTLGAAIELLAVSSGKDEVLYSYTVLYQGERRQGWFDAPVNADDDWLGLWSLLKAEFDNPDITNAVIEMLGKSMENATPRDVTRLVFSM